MIVFFYICWGGNCEERKSHTHTQKSQTKQDKFWRYNRPLYCGCYNMDTKMEALFKPTIKRQQVLLSISASIIWNCSLCVNNLANNVVPFDSKEGFVFNSSMQKNERPTIIVVKSVATQIFKSFCQLVGFAQNVQQTVLDYWRVCVCGNTYLFLSHSVRLDVDRPVSRKCLKIFV